MASTNRTSPSAGFIKNPKSSKHARGENGRLLCRQCKVEVPKGRRTFCSDLCVHEWKVLSDPAYLREMVFRRDRGVCAECHRDCEALYKEVAKRFREPNYREALIELEAEGFDFRSRYYGITRGTLWQADHIVPVIEGGGECGLENLQTLCTPCHKAATAALRKRLAVRKRCSGQLELFESRFLC